MSDDRLALHALIAEEALSLKKVILASGKESNFYLDCKKITLQPQGLYWVTKLFYEKLQRLGFPEAVGGPTLGADPLTAGLVFYSQTQGHPMFGFIIRKEPKSHGTSQWIEGLDSILRHHPGATKISAVLLEDVVTTAGSSLKAIAKARETALDIRQVLCIVDRQEGGREALAQEGIELHALFTKEDFLKTS